MRNAREPRGGRESAAPAAAPGNGREGRGAAGEAAAPLRRSGRQPGAGWEAVPRMSRPLRRTAAPPSRIPETSAPPNPERDSGVPGPSPGSRSRPHLSAPPGSSGLSATAAHARTLPLAPPSRTAPRLAGSKRRDGASRRAPRARLLPAYAPRGTLGFVVRRSRRGTAAGTRRSPSLPVSSPAANGGSGWVCPLALSQPSCGGRDRHSWALITLTPKPEIRIIHP